MKLTDEQSSPGAVGMASFTAFDGNGQPFCHRGRATPRKNGLPTLCSVRSCSNHPSIDGATATVELQFLQPSEVREKVGLCVLSQGGR